MKRTETSKKRRLVQLFVGFIVVVFVLGGIALATVTRHPGLTQDWTQTINARLAELEPDGEPAWPIYQEIYRVELGVRTAGPDVDGLLDYSDATPLVRRFNEIRNDPDIPWPNEAPWSDSRMDSYRELLPLASDVFRKLDIAAECPRMGKRYEYDMNSYRTGEPRSEPGPSLPVAWTPNLQSLRLIGQIHHLRLRELSEAGSWEEYVTAVRTHAVLAEHSSLGMMLDLLSGLSTLSTVLHTVRHDLVEFEVPASEARRLDRVLAEHANMREWFDVALELETLYGLGAIEAAVRVTTVFGPSLEDMQHDYREMTGDVNTSFDLPGSEFPAYYEQQRQREARSTIEEAVLPAFASFTRALRINQRDIRATRIMLRLEAIYAEAGDWPASLDEYVELAELNECPLTGKPFVYSLTPDDPHGRAYTLHAPETPWEDFREDDYTELRAEYEPE